MCKMTSCLHKTLSETYNKITQNQAFVFRFVRNGTKTILLYNFYKSILVFLCSDMPWAFSHLICIELQGNVVSLNELFL